MFSLMPWKKQRDESGALATRSEQPLSLFPNLDTVIDRFFGDLPALFNQPWPGWGLTTRESDEDVVYHIDAPGFEADDFDIRAAAGVLTIYAEHKEKGNAEAERYLERSITLPLGVDPDKVEAKYRNGVLVVRMPKTEEAKPRKIVVKTI